MGRGLIEETGPRVRARAATAIALVAVVFVCGGCSSGTSDPDITGVWVPDETAVDRYVPGVDPVEAAIEFTDGGTWDGRNGCIDVSGTYTIDGADFAAGSMAGAPAIDCVPGSVPYLRLLGDAQSVARTDDVLEFRDVDGDLILRMVSAGGSG